MLVTGFVHIKGDKNELFYMNKQFFRNADALFGIIHKGGTKLDLHVGDVNLHVGNADVIKSDLGCS